MQRFISQGTRRIMITTVDSDIMAISLFAFVAVNEVDPLVQELWMEMGVGQNRCWYPIHGGIDRLVLVPLEIFCKGF